MKVVALIILAIALVSADPAILKNKFGAVEYVVETETERTK